MRITKICGKRTAVWVFLVVLMISAAYIGGRLYLRHRIIHLIQDEGKGRDKENNSLHKYEILSFMAMRLKILGPRDIIYNCLMDGHNWDKPGAAPAFRALAEVSINKAFEICREKYVRGGSGCPQFDAAVAWFVMRYSNMPKKSMKMLMLRYTRDNEWYAAVYLLGATGDPLAVAELKRILFDFNETDVARRNALRILSEGIGLAAEEQALVCAELKRFADNGIKPDEDASWLDGLIDATYWSANKEAMKVVIGMIKRADEATAKKACAAIPSSILKMPGAFDSTWTREASLQAAREYYTKVFKEPYAAP